MNCSLTLGVGNSETFTLQSFNNILHLSIGVDKELSLNTRVNHVLIFCSYMGVDEELSFI